MNREKKLSGERGEEVTEFGVLIEELIELSDDTDACSEEKAKEKKETTEEDRKKALDIRNTAMECFSETRKRGVYYYLIDSCRSGSNALTFLCEKMEVDKEYRRIEKEERSAERTQAQNQQNIMQQQFNALLSQQTQILKMLAEKMN